MGFVVVEMSDMKIASPPDLLITYALGSCVGICLLDTFASLAGLSHIMLPDSSMAPQDHNIYKFANTAIPELVRQIVAKGALRSRLQAKIAGGAQMFEVQAGKHSSAWQIGQRNVEAVTETLRQMQIPIIGQDVLKNYGRTVTIDPATGVMTVKALGQIVNKL